MKKSMIAKMINYAKSFTFYTALHYYIKSDVIKKIAETRE